jgi:hypothetical protein
MRVLNNFLTTAVYTLGSILILLIFGLAFLYAIKRNKQDNINLEPKTDNYIPYTGYLKTNGPDINYVGDDWRLSRKNHREIAKIAEQSGRSANYLVEQMIKQYRRY